MKKDSNSLEQSQPVSRFLTPPQAAKILEVNRATILKFIHSGELRALNVSTGTQRNRWKIKRVDFEEFINGLEPCDMYARAVSS